MNFLSAIFSNVAELLFNDHFGDVYQIHLGMEETSIITFAILNIVIEYITSFYPH